MRKDFATLTEIDTINISPSLPQGTYRVTVQWGERNTQVLQGLRDTGPDLTLIPGDLKCCCGPSITVGAHGGHVRSTSWWAQWLTELNLWLLS